MSCIDLSAQHLSHAVINMLILLYANKHGWISSTAACDELRTSKQLTMKDSWISDQIISTV